MANSAGNVPLGNGGQTDQGRGNTATFVYDKSQRKTGKVADVVIVPNAGDEDGNKVTVNDPRTTAG